MVRFIFACMGITFVAILTMVSQGMISGIENAEQTIAARNTPRAMETSVASDTAITADSLNNIETAAGAFNDDGRNDHFGKSFTSDAPKALSDEPVAAENSDRF